MFGISQHVYFWTSCSMHVSHGLLNNYDSVILKLIGFLVHLEVGQYYSSWADGLLPAYHWNHLNRQA